MGANANETVTLAVGGFSSKNLGLNNVNLVENSQLATVTIDDALRYVDDQRAGLGAFMNRMESTMNNLANIQENVSASRSRIQDTDYAIESAKLVSLQIKQQAITAMMAHSKAMPELMLRLLG